MSAIEAELFDHVVGAGEQGWRDRKPERLGSLQVDDQLELGPAARLEGLR
jgi:hypothetical protein